MKNSKQVYLCIAFLFLFLSSFSANVYISLNSSAKNLRHCVNTKEVQQSTPSTAAEDLLFEETETEDDSEQLLSSCFILLPAFSSSLSFHSHLRATIAGPSSALTPAESIFISIRVLRI